MYIFSNTLAKMPSLPKNEKTAEWIHVRLHKNPTDTQYEDFFKRNFDSSISCYETHSNRPHVHILVKIRTMRSVQLTDTLKAMFGVRGNTDFSVGNVEPTEKDLKNISQYVCKGEDSKTLPVVVFKTDDWTDEIVKMHHDNYYLYESEEVLETEQQQIVVKVDLNQLELPKKRIRQPTFTEKIIDQLQDEYEDVDWDWHEPKHRQWMIQYVLKKLGEKKKIFNEYKVKEFVYGCFNHLDAKNYRTDMGDKVYQIL